MLIIKRAGLMKGPALVLCEEGASANLLASLHLHLTDIE